MHTEEVIKAVVKILTPFKKIKMRMIKLLKKIMILIIIIIIIIIIKRK